MKTTALLAEAKTALDPTAQIPYLENQFYADVSNADKCLVWVGTERMPTRHTNFSD